MPWVLRPSSLSPTPTHSSKTKDVPCSADACPNTQTKTNPTHLITQEVTLLMLLLLEVRDAMMIVFCFCLGTCPSALRHTQRLHSKGSSPPLLSQAAGVAETEAQEKAGPPVCVN